MMKILLTLLLIPITAILMSLHGQISMQPERDTPDLVKVYVKQDPATYQKSSKPKSEIDFAVQVSASSKPVSESQAKKEWNGIGHVYVQQENGMYKTRIGPYATQLEAKEVLLQVKSKGRKDAFIVVLQGNANDKPLYQAGMDTKPAPITKTQAKPSVVTEPKAEAAPLASNSEYKVQVAAYSKPGSFNTDGIDKLGKLESYRKGELTLMMIGGFKNLTDAKNARNIVVSKGFTDASIVMENNGLLEPVKD